MERILLVEDEERLCATVAKGLVDQGFGVETSLDGFEGYRMAREGDFDLLVLDWMLPNLSGIDICRRLRQEGVATPILVLTAKDGVTDETGALDAGADDYVRKPFEFSVLVARCDALLRRRTRGLRQDVIFDDLTLDARRRVVRIGAERVSLSRRESEVLEYLMRANGAVRSKDDLLRDVWGNSSGVDVNSVEVYVVYLRRKLDPVAGRRVVETVRGAGYRLASP